MWLEAQRNQERLLLLQVTSRFTRCIIWLEADLCCLVAASIHGCGRCLGAHSPLTRADLCFIAALTDVLQNTGPLTAAVCSTLDPELKLSSFRLSFTASCTLTVHETNEESGSGSVSDLPVEREATWWLQQSHGGVTSPPGGARV